MLAPTADMRILDVGTGTGIVAARMRHSAGRTAVIVGVDGSLTMLDEAGREYAYPVVAACLPQLPFVSDTFDMAAAGFVISHVAAYEAALKDIARVCRGGARIGMTVWGSLRNAAAQLWADIASQYVARTDLDEAFRAHIPWDAWFSEPGRLEHALQTAGLNVTTVDTRVYRVRMSTRDFLLSREGSIQGAVLREQLSADRWKQCQGQLLQAFEAAFGAVVEYDKDVHFGVAQKA